MHQPESCLVVGQRIDLQIDEEIRFDCPDWSVQLENRARDDGSLHPAYGSDYFVFPREYYHSLPAFVVGRLGWDNWMITHAHEVGLHVVDASGYLLVLHQNHDYGHQVGSHNARGHDSAAPEARQNCKLAGSRLFGLEGATNLLTENGEMRHNKNPKRIIKQLWYDLCRLNRDKDIK